MTKRPATDVPDPHGAVPEEPAFETTETDDEDNGAD